MVIPNMRRTSAEVGYRTAVIPVALSGGAYTRSHEAAHAAALLWNSLVGFQKNYWSENHSDPTTKQMRHHLAAADGSLQLLHAHTRQAIVDDLQDAVSTYRSNQANGIRSRAPWRAKNYRPLSFTRGYGWRVAPDGRLALSFGRGRERILLPMPTVTDSATGDSVAVSGWGEIRLCWDIDARKWSLHIGYRTSRPAPLNAYNTLAIDEGIINPMALAVATADGLEVTVINGREARAVKHRRNKAVSELRKRMARCHKGSRRWKKLRKAEKRDSTTATRKLHNIDHQVSRKAADLARRHDTGTIVIGDVRGIERNTRRTEKRRFGKNQRRRLSQWSRGRQERYLAEKTGVDVSHINEAYSSKTCPACLTRNRPSGRNYQCRGCGFACHRDAVGAINILMRSLYGEYRRIDPDTSIRVIYLRATPLRVSTQSKARNRATREANLSRVADPDLHACVPNALTGMGDLTVATLSREAV